MFHLNKFLSIYYLKFIPLVFHILMLIFLIVRGIYLNSIVIYRYCSIMLLLIALYYIFYSIELKKNRMLFTKQILIATVFTIISINYLLRSYNIEFLW